MGFVGVSVLLDFVSSIAVLGLLVVGFAALGPALKSRWISAPLLGLLFACVVGLQMSMPLNPTDGVIIDMRNIPVVLAGAFLGLRGLLTCLCLAIAMRIGLGGIGAFAGVLGMMIAGGIGYAWAQTRHRFRCSSGWALAILGLAMNAHMLSAFAVPVDIMQWYFLYAAPTVFVLNVTCVPALGWLLLREQDTIKRHADLSAAAQVDPVTRLLTPDAFSREVSHLHAADSDLRIAGMIALTLKDGAWLKSTWGEDARDQALGGLRMRLVALFGDARPLGRDAQNRVLVPVTEGEMRNLRPIRHTLRRLASETPMRLDGDVAVPLSVVAESVTFRHPDKPLETLKDIRNAASARRSPPSGAKGRTAPRPARQIDTTLPTGVCRATFKRLFDETDAHLRQAARSG